MYKLEEQQRWKHKTAGQEVILLVSVVDSKNDEVVYLSREGAELNDQYSTLTTVSRESFHNDFERLVHSFNAYQITPRMSVTAFCFCVRYPGGSPEMRQDFLDALKSRGVPCHLNDDGYIIVVPGKGEPIRVMPGDNLIVGPLQNENRVAYSVCDDKTLKYAFQILQNVELNLPQQEEQMQDSVQPFQGLTDNYLHRARSSVYGDLFVLAYNPRSISDRTGVIAMLSRRSDVFNVTVKPDCLFNLELDLKGFRKVPVLASGGVLVTNFRDHLVVYDQKDFMTALRVGSVRPSAIDEIFR